ncbi:MAG TPA: IMP dehydrogenase [Gammaproteobacteria bacterium]|nr:IMP dehydrogenase [Gammaproteobacteria bacterium]
MKILQEALTFDDVLLVPRHTEILPKEVQLATKLTKTISLNIPVLSSAMDTVTESRLAIALAQEGGIGIIHKNMTIEEQAREVRKVKKFESGVVKDPITVTPKISVKELLKITEANNISGVPVVDGEQLVGIVTGRDIRFETNLNQPVSNIMTPKNKLITVKQGASREEIINLLHKNRIEKILVINDKFQLRGLITVKDIQKAKTKPFACKDDYGHLRVGAAVGINPSNDERIKALVEARVDVLVVDTAHGHAQSVLDRVKWIKKHFPQVQIIAGNIATADAAKALIKAGADGLKVGVGPGSICTTRIISGVGVPQITAIQNVYAVAHKANIPVISDGGIRYSGDICKALAAGSSCVMIGSLFAGTEESPGEIELYQGRTYKSYRGMGSLGAMAQGSSERYFQDAQENSDKLVPEGIEGRVPYKGALANIIFQLMGGVRSGMGYLGAKTVKELQKKAEWVKITSAGFREGHVHDVTMTKEPPNYAGE